MGVPAPRTPCPQPWRVLAGPGPRAWALVSVLPPVLPFHLVLSRQVFPRPSCGSARSRVLGSPLRSAAAWRVAPGSAFSRGAGARTHRSGPGCGAACFLSADFPLLVSAACGASSSLNPELGRCPRSTGFWGSSGWGVGGRGEESWPWPNHPVLLLPRPPVRSFLVSDLVAQLRPAPGCSPHTPPTLGFTGLLWAQPGRKAEQHAHGSRWEALGGATSRGLWGSGTAEGPSGASVPHAPPSEGPPMGLARTQGEPVPDAGSAWGSGRQVYNWRMPPSPQHSSPGAESLLLSGEVGAQVGRDRASSSTWPLTPSPSAPGP